MATKHLNLRNVLAGSFGTRYANAVLRIRNSANTTLVQFTIATFSAAANARVSANGVPISGTATAAGVATNAVLVHSGGTIELDGLTVGTTGTQVIIDNTNIASGQIVNLLNFHWTEGETF
jgi:hypothetical protein